MILYIDTEGSGLHPDDGARVSYVSWCYRDSHGIKHVEGLPFGQGPEHEHDAGLKEWNRLMKWFGDHLLVMHNAKYDLTMLRAGTIHGHPGTDLLANLHWDTNLGQTHLDPMHLSGLKDSAARLLGADDWEGDLDEALKRTKPRKRYDLVPLEVIEPYALNDVSHGDDLFYLQCRRLEEGEGSPAKMHAEMRVCRVLTAMEWRGIRFDPRPCAEDAGKLRREMARLERGLPFGPTPTKATRYYWDELGMRWPQVTEKKRAPQMNEEVRRDLIKKRAPHARQWDRWCRLETAATSWYEPYPRMLGADGRLRTVYRQSGTVSGRFSASRANLQAIPQDKRIPDGVRPVRSFIKPAPRKKLFEVDVSQAEVRVAAAITPSPAMVETLVSGQDVHTMVALRMFPDVDPGSPDFQEVYRQFGKRVVYLTLYGGGAGVLVEQIRIHMDLEITLNRAYEILDLWRDAFPEFRRAESREQAMVETNGFVTTAYGIQSWFRPWEQSYKGFNRKIQGSVGEIMKRAMVQVEDELPGRQLLQIHDSLVLETSRKTEAQRVAQILKDEFEYACPTVPFVVDVKSWSH